MIKRLVSSCTVLVCTLLLTASCGKDDVTVKEVNTRSSAIVGKSVKTSYAALDSLAAMSTWTSIDAALADLDLAFASVPSMTPTTDSTAALPPPPPDQVVEATADEPTPEEVAQAVEDFLREYIFTEQNLEKQDDKSATFLLRGEAICGEVQTCTYITCDGTDPTCVPQDSCTSEVDQGCIDAIDAAELRIKAIMVGDDGVDLVIMIGPNRASPLTFELRPNSIAVVLDLGEAKDAAEFIADLSGESTDLPRVMEGVTRLALIVNGEQDITVEASVLQAIAFEFDDANGTNRIDIGASDPVWRMRAQGLIGRLTMDVDAKTFDVSMPYANVTNDGSGTGTFSVHAGGASYSVVLDEGMNALNITNIGLGDSSLTIKKDDATIFSLDLNASSGRRFDLTVVPQGDSALFTVTPELDLSETFAMQAIAAEFPDIEPYFMDETYRVQLTGAGSASVLPVPEDPINSWYGGLEVVSGTLTISSTAAASDVVVATGECLTGTDTPPTGSHPVLGHFVVTACP